MLFAIYWPLISTLFKKMQLFNSFSVLLFQTIYLAHSLFVTYQFVVALVAVVLDTPPLTVPICVLH